MMEQIMNYVKPELIVVAVVLYFIGMGLKQSQTAKDKYIPLILGGIGIVLCAVWVIASCPISTGQEIAMAVFTAIVQGILVAGLSTYVNQTMKQMSKEEKNRLNHAEKHDMIKNRTTVFDMIPSSRTQKYKNLLGGILCPEKVKLMQ